MKILINGVIEKEIKQPKYAAPHTRDLMETSGPIKPEDVHNIVDIVFTVAEAIKILIAAFKSWFKK